MHSLSSQVVFKAIFYFCLTLFFHSRMVKEVKRSHRHFPIILAKVKNFSLKCYFLDDGLKSQQLTVQLFWNRIIFEKFAIIFFFFIFSLRYDLFIVNKINFCQFSLPTSKAASGYIGQIVRHWIMGNVPRFEKKSALTGTVKVSCKSLAGASKFPPVTCGNHRQSLPAEIFACIRRYF